MKGLGYMQVSPCQKISTAAFTFFSAWMISFPYEGMVLYSLAAQRHIEIGSWMQASIILLIVGLLSGVFVHSLERAKHVLLASGLLCFFGSVALLFAPPSWWVAILLSLAFCEGLWMSSWSWFFRECTPKGERLRSASSYLAYSAMLMIVVNLLTTRLIVLAGFVFSCALLLMSLVLIYRIPVNDLPTEKIEAVQTNPLGVSFTTLLCGFIFIISINSGLMFSVVNPAFAHFTGVVDWYWAVPYIVAILLIPRLPKSIDRMYILYVALAMLGFSFLAFMTLGRSMADYFTINTLLLAACGINDLFWWTLLGELLNYTHNPAQLLGIGLTANLGGILTGELLSAHSLFTENAFHTSILGLFVVCVSLFILPLLLAKISKWLLQNDIQDQDPLKEDSNNAIAYEEFAALSKRENQIAQLLLNGYTRQLIASELGISETTVKTHIRNIYTKLEISSKTELIQKIHHIE